MHSVNARALLVVKKIGQAKLERRAPPSFGNSPPLKEVLNMPGKARALVRDHESHATAVPFFSKASILQRLPGRIGQNQEVQVLIQAALREEILPRQPGSDRRDVF